LEYVLKIFPENSTCINNLTTVAVRNVEDLWTFIISVDIYYICGYLLYLWIFIISVDIYYICGYLLYLWTFIISVDIYYICGHLLYLWIFVISVDILLRVRNVSGKDCKENQNPHFMFNGFPPSPPPPKKKILPSLG